MGDGVITERELARLLGNVRVIAYLESIQLKPESCQALFRLLNTTEDGRVDIDTFVEGCSKLRGPARNFDLALLKFETLQLCRKNHAEMMEAMEELRGMTSSAAG